MAGDQEFNDGFRLHVYKQGLELLEQIQMLKVMRNILRTPYNELTPEIWANLVAREEALEFCAEKLQHIVDMTPDLSDNEELIRLLKERAEQMMRDKGIIP